MCGANRRRSSSRRRAASAPASLREPVLALFSARGGGITNGGLPRNPSCGPHLRDKATKDGQRAVPGHPEWRACQSGNGIPAGERHVRAPASTFPVRAAVPFSIALLSGLAAGEAIELVGEFMSNRAPAACATHDSYRPQARRGEDTCTGVCRAGESGRRSGVRADVVYVRSAAVDPTAVEENSL